MENQSMRRRQTVLGEQLQAQNGDIPNFGAPSARQGANYSSVNGPSGSSLAIPGAGFSAQSGASGLGLKLPNGSKPDSHQLPAIPGTNSTNSVGSVPNLSAPSRSGHMRSFSRMSARIVANDETGALTIADQSSVRSAKFDEDDFDPQLMGAKVDPVIFLSRNLAGASAEDVLRFGESLKQQAQRAADLEQHSLQRNQKSLTQVASNVAKLAPAVADLRRKVGDLSLVTDAICQDALAAQTGASLAQSRRLSLPQTNRRGANGSSVGPRSTEGFEGANGADSSDEDELDEDEAADLMRSNKRQSMFVLNTAWAQDLNELYKRVDGAQRILPPAPGRHLVLEEQGWMEMNMVTQQPIKPILLVLLSDFFFIATHHHGRFTQTWHTALDEPLEVSINESQKILKVAQLGLLAPSLARLRAVYSELCKLNELASSGSTGSRVILSRSGSRVASRRSQRRSRQPGAQTHNRSHSRSHSRTHSRSNSGNALAGLGGLPGQRNHRRDVSHHSISSIPEVNLERRREGARILADVEAAIAERRYSEAAELCLEYEDDLVVGPLVRERSDNLAELLLNQVRNISACTREELAANIQLLIRLGRAPEAKTTMLQAAAADIEDQARQVHFMGDVSSYISQMAAIYFQTINATVTVYRKMFPEKEDSSVVVAWTKSQVDIYAAIFNRQLFRIAPEFQAYKRCREVSRLESSQLRDHKMDMDFMLRYVWES